MSPNLPSHNFGRDNKMIRTNSTVLMRAERIHTVVIGGGQAGLAVGYYLARRGIPFVILEANERIGDTWRNRWDSLRLFTPARYDALPGMPFPASPTHFPTKDEMGDYLEAYAARFKLPVRTGVRVEHLYKSNGRYVVDAGTVRFEAENVVVAMATFQKPAIPSFAGALAPNVRQIHSSEYRNPSQLQPGGVLVVGAANSGAEIALDIARAGKQRDVWLAGRHPGHVPRKIDSFFSQYIMMPILLRFVFHRLLTIDTPMGRRARAKMLHKGARLVRAKPRDLDVAGIHRVPRMVGVENGRPLLEDRGLLGVTNVIWSTGFTPGFSWIDLPVFDETGDVAQRAGFTETEPGVSFVGLHWLYAMSSTMIHGVSRDAKRIVDAIASRPRSMETWEPVTRSEAKDLVSVAGGR